jgi:carbon storage regulator
MARKCVRSSWGVITSRSFPQNKPQEGNIMLVLTRRCDEAIVLHDANGNEIRLSVVDIRGSKVRIGIEAPRQVSIVREEVLELDPLADPVPREMAWI